MKRFIFSMLAVTVFFLGLGALVDRTAAKFKSDEKALDLIRKARLALGGEAAIAGVQSMLIKGRTTQIVRVDGTERSHVGDTEIAFQLPDKMMKRISIGDPTAAGEHHRIMSKQVDVIASSPGERKFTVKLDGEPGTTAHRIVIKKDDGTVQELTGEEAAKWIAKEHPGLGSGEHTIVMKRKDGTTEELKGDKNVMVRRGDGGTATFTTKDGKTFDIKDKHVMLERTGGGAAAHHTAARNNEMLRTTLSLLASAPQGMDVNYTFGGECNLEGRACNIVNAALGGQSFKLYLDAVSNLPLAIGYRGMPAPQIVRFSHDAPGAAGGEKDVVFMKKAMGTPELGDVMVRFSDYRAVNGVQLPFRWTQSVGGSVCETFDVTSYELNPANISERFQDQNVMVRREKTK